MRLISGVADYTIGLVIVVAHLVALSWRDVGATQAAAAAERLPN
jgi:hypothetical protein